MAFDLPRTAATSNIGLKLTGILISVLENPLCTLRLSQDLLD